MLEAPVEPGSTNATDPGAPPATPSFDGVSVDDPFPPQADGLTDPAVADAAIRWAYQHWILIDLDPATRARIVENGEQNTANLERGIADARGTIDGAGMAVDEVRLTGVDTAAVVFRARWQGGPSPIFPDPITGTAVFQNGSWRIGTHTLCLLALGIGQSCEPTAPLLAPAAFRAREIPLGFTWVGDAEFEGIVPVPGGGYWMASAALIEEQPGGVGLSLTFEVIPGYAALTDDDIEVLLRARGGAGDRVPIEIGDARGWMDAQPGFTNIVLIRPDDVLVLAGGQMTSTQLMTILGELERTELPAGLVASTPVATTVTNGISFEL